jgi:hypothetical protein
MAIGSVPPLSAAPRTGGGGQNHPVPPASGSAAARARLVSAALDPHHLAGAQRRRTHPHPGAPALPHRAASTSPIVSRPGNCACFSKFMWLYPFTFGHYDCHARDAAAGAAADTAESTHTAASAVGYPRTPQLQTSPPPQPAPVLAGQEATSENRPGVPVCSCLLHHQPAAQHPHLALELEFSGTVRQQFDGHGVAFRQIGALVEVGEHDHFRA